MAARARTRARSGAGVRSVIAQAVGALLAANRRGLIPAHYTDSMWWRDRNRTQPWVYPQDLEQQVQYVDDLTGQPRGWSLGADLLGGAGAFTSATGWTQGTGWSISGGAASGSAGSGSDLSYSVTVTAGRLYRVDVEVTARTAGTITPRLTGGSTVSGTAISTTGRFASYLTAVSGNNTLTIAKDASFAGTIDNVTVQEVTRDESWLGANLFTDPGFNNPGDWSYGGSTPGWNVTDGRAEVTQTAAANRWLSNGSRLTIGKTYLISADVVVTAGSCGPDVSATAAGDEAATGRYQWAVLASTTNLQFIARSNFIGSIDNVSCREIPGHPLVSPSAGNGPVATARVNLLQRTDVSSGIGTAYFSGNSGSASSPVITPFFAQAPDGTMTACRVQLSLGGGTTTSDRAWLSSGSAPLDGITRKRLVYLRAVSGTPTVMSRLHGTTQTLTLNSSQWTPVTIYSSSASDVTSNLVEIRGGQTTTNSNTADVLVWGADLRLAVWDSLSLPAYQRVGDGTAGVFDYDHVGFPVRLNRGSANRGLMTLGTLDLTGTDAVSAGMWALKTNDAATAMLMEHGVISNSGSMYLAASEGGSNYSAQSRGSAIPASALVTGTINAPHIAALLSSPKIGTPIRSLSVNGAAPVTSALSQGAGNFGNYRFYEGGRSLDSGPSLSFSGEWLPGFIADANAVDSTLAAAMLREIAARVGHTY